MKHAKLFFGFVPVFLGMFCFAAPAAAFVMRTGSEVMVSKGESIDGTLVVTGQTVTVDGDVKGDVICAGQTIFINGNVDGDVICAGQTITVSNSVSGSVRAVGQVINLGGKIGRNVTVAGQTVKTDSEIGGEMLFGSQSAIIGGRITKNIAGAAESITVNGNIGGDAQFKNEQLNVKNGAVIGGALSYESANVAALEQGSQIARGTQRFEPPVTEKVPMAAKKKETAEEKVLEKTIELLCYLALAVFFAVFFKRHMQRTADSMLARPFRSFGLGLLILILVPVAAIAFMISIIGIPVGLLGFLLYATALFFSRIFTAIAIGRKLVQKYHKAKQDSLPVQALVGVVGMWILFAIPIFGAILSFLSVIWGLGGIYYLFKKEAMASAAAI